MGSRAVRHDILEFCARVLVTTSGQTAHGELGTSTAAAWEKRLLTRCYSDRPYLKAVLKLPNRLSPRARSVEGFVIAGSVVLRGIELNTGPAKWRELAHKTPECRGKQHRGSFNRQQSLTPHSRSG